MKDEPFNRHIESARHSLQALRGRLRTSPGAPGAEIAGHLDDIGTALNAVAREWSQQRDALASMQTKIAEGARAELALRASEGQLRGFFHASPAGMAVLDTELRYLRINERLANMNGQPVEAHLGKTVREILPAFAHVIEPLCRQVFMNGKPLLDHELGRETTRAAGMDGDWIISYFPVPDRNGTPAALGVVVTDISARKRAEEERLVHLRFIESMDRINQAMQGTNDLEQMMSDVLDEMLSIFDCDRASLVYPCDPKTTSWHAPMERTRPEYPGALAMGLEVPMDRDVVRVFRTILASSVPVQFGSGSAYPLPAELTQRFGAQSQIAMVLYPKVGKPWMFILQQCSRPRVWTLEERKLFEEIGRRLTDSLTSLLTHRDLRESEARLRALFENSMVGILLSAPDGRVFAANPAACRLFGRTEADICRLGRSGLVDRRDPRVNAFAQERTKKGYAVSEMTLVRADGACFPAQVASVVFETAEGPRTSMVIQDISERKLSEARVRDFSRKLLSVREEEKRGISAVLHHDVGSFTVGVTAYLNAVEEDLRKGKYKEALAALKKGHRLFVQSVRRLKTLAVELRPPDLDILGLPAALRQHFALLTSETSLKIRFTDATCGKTIPPETQTVLFRVVQESLNNVVKHAHARQVRVRLSAPWKTFRLSIVDDGKGFNPVRAAARPGARLGLRVAQEMVVALGGEFMVDASSGRGTTVLVTVLQGGPKT